MRVNLALLFVIVAMFGGSSILGQSPNASVSGVVLDPDKKSIAEAEILVVNDFTRIQYQTKSNAEGFFAVTNLPPGQYRIQVSKVGFKAIIKPDIVLNVQDALAVNFTLPIGASSVVVTVEGGAPMINTTDGSVSTVVDRNFVENMPLNGRSFQDLILLVPGVVSNSPQSTSYLGVSGEFSVNGQRTESNYYSVDGVSANVGVFPGQASYAASSGSLPVSTALGTTQGLVSIDALEEFRVQGSTYSAEYGRNSGGQISFVTRSGTNEWHGSAFDYLRNGVFDANDWFNDYYRVPEAPLRQNDFGGTLGGPMQIPDIYNGKDKTFLFFSYEGLRLTQPQEASLSYVPTAGSSGLRTGAPGALQPFLNAFPLPFCPAGASACSTDIGDGLGDFVGAWSNPSDINSTSIRIDEAVNNRVRMFFRFSNTGSEANSRQGGNFHSPSNPSSLNFGTRTYTFGLGPLFGGVSNEFRLNYTSNRAVSRAQIDNFGGASPANLAALQGIPSGGSAAYSLEMQLSFSAFAPTLDEQSSLGLQKQWNVTDTVSLLAGRHRLKFGADYRRLSPFEKPFSPLIFYNFFSPASVQANQVDIGVGENNDAAFPRYVNFSLFGEDEWHVAQHLTINAGLRWDVNPAPGAPRGNLPFTVEGNNSLGTLSLAPQGTALWRTSWFNLAPRLGGAYVLRDRGEFETVVRGGGGVFFDTGQQLGSLGYGGPGFSATTLFGTFLGVPTSFPAAPATVIPVIVDPPKAPYGTVYAFPSHLQLPYTLEWNATVEQSFGKSQMLTISYVGAHGARLLEENEINVQPFNPDFGYVYFIGNGLTSDYGALQARFQRRLTAGLQALASYTWSHSIDYGSQNATIRYARGNSDFDVRHNFNAALSYELPGMFSTRAAKALLHHWGLDGRVAARSAFPVPLQGNGFYDPGTGRFYYGGLDVVPGEPIYIYGPSYPGGRAINSAAFSPVTTANEVGNAPRNFARGFAASQVDIAVRREFPIHENWRLQFRAEAFNVLNHPNFGAISTTYCAAGPACTFGQATATLASSLGTLSKLYQMGGPRSMQFALKVSF